MECLTAESETDPRVIRTRKLLHDAFISLVHERRLADISVQDIAARATLNRATFYAHYNSKEELAVSVLKADLHKAVCSRFSGRPPLTPEHLVEFGVAVFEFLGEIHGNCPKAGAELQNVIGAAVRETLHDLISGWLTPTGAWRKLFPGSSKNAVATVVSWSIYGGAYLWIQSKRREPAVDVCREIVAVLIPQPAG